MKSVNFFCLKFNYDKNLISTDKNLIFTDKNLNPIFNVSITEKILSPSGEILEDISSAITSQSIRGIYILDDGVDRELDDSWKTLLENMDFVIVQTYAMTELAKLAKIVLPGLAPFEREGTITNDQGRVQWLRPSIPIKGDSKPDWEILMLVRNALQKDSEQFADLGGVIKRMSDQFPDYAGVSLIKVGAMGIAVNGKNT